jgi:hypothetical protein
MKLLAAVAILLFWHTPARAQAVANATIHGEISDASGAAVPNAQIRAVQTATGQILTTVSGADGDYVLPNLPVGPYRVEVMAPSFSTYVQSDITLQVGNNVQINVKLQVGAVTQEVQVSANAAMVETQDTSVSEVIDQHFGPMSSRRNRRFDRNKEREFRSLVASASGASPRQIPERRRDGRLRWCHSPAPAERKRRLATICVNCSPLTWHAVGRRGIGGNAVQSTKTKVAVPKTFTSVRGHRGKPSPRERRPAPIGS